MDGGKGYSRVEQARYEIDLPLEHLSFVSRCVNR